jgi:acetyltransferase
MSRHLHPHHESIADLSCPEVRGPLDAIFAAKRIALIGATETPRSVGLALMQNLSGPHFDGKVYPVNPKRGEVCGVPAWPKVSAIPDAIDLAVIVTPASTVPGLIAECAAAKVPAAIIISAGFKECGAGGAELEKQINAHRGSMRIIGPNCLGVMAPHAGLNATFAANMARPGSVAFISQSGALCTAVLDWSLREQVGFSAFVSLGSMLDVGWGDLIYHFGDDPNTKSIVCYMESVGHAREFLSAAREVALTKPIIVIKAGRTEAAAKAAASHTGSLTGSDAVLDAAFRRAGVLRVNNIEELFDMSEVLGKQPRPKGRRLAIVTNAGGPGCLATDALISQGGQLAELSAETMQKLNGFLPPHWSHGNPVDVLGDAGPDCYAKAIELVAQDPNTDGVLVVLTPQAMTDPTATAEELRRFAKLEGKPLLASWMGGGGVSAGIDILNAVGIPTFAYPDRAAQAFNYMWLYSENLRLLYETPTLAHADAGNETARSRVANVIGSCRQQGRHLLTEIESKELLAAYGIPIVRTLLARSEDEAVELAKELGYPVVLKLCSTTITHKTDVGGVKLNLGNTAAVRSAWREIVTASQGGSDGGPHDHPDFLGVTVQPMILNHGYELILGSSLDPQFGPVLLFGTGGQLVEVFQDRALGLPPLNTTLARRLIEQTKIYGALKGVRGRKPVNLHALEELLVRFSQLIAEQPAIQEIDINPLLASAEGILALDARIVLAPSDAPAPELAISPYPIRYISAGKLADGTPVTFRPIRPEDEPLMVKFHQTLSEQSVYSRYFGPLRLDQRISHERLARSCFNDYAREVALVADHYDEALQEHEILGVGRLSKVHGVNEAEFALLISDCRQGQGLGAELLFRLIHIGRDQKLNRIIARILPDNRAMLHLCRKTGFRIHHQLGEPDCEAELSL